MKYYQMSEKVRKNKIYLEKTSAISNFKFLGSFGKVQKIRRKTDNKVLVWKELNYGIMSEKEKQ